MDQCTELHLKCIIARLEYGRTVVMNNRPNRPVFGIPGQMPRALDVIDRLIIDANRSLNTRFPHNSITNNNSN